MRRSCDFLLAADAIVVAVVDDCGLLAALRQRIFDDDVGMSELVGIDAKDVVAERIEQFPVRRDRGDERDLAPVHERDHRQRASAERARNQRKDTVLIDQAPHRGHRLLRRSSVVVGDQLDLAAVHPARRIDFVDRDLDRVALGGAEQGYRSCQRRPHAERDLGRRDAGIGGDGLAVDAEHRRNQGKGDQPAWRLHLQLLQPVCTNPLMNDARRSVRTA